MQNGKFKSNDCLTFAEFVQDEQELIILRQRYAELEAKCTNLQNEFEKKGEYTSHTEKV